jgi:hypothetical protein
MGDKNAFGGGNARSLYVPMSETEQEVLERLVAADDLEVVIHDWGIVNQPMVTFGDLRLTLSWRMNFNRPEVPQPVHYFDLELRTRAGLRLFGPDRLSTEYDGKPIQVAAGMYIDMAWDIAIQKIDPALVKALKPGAIGLTSAEGNRKLDPQKAKLLKMLREGEAAVRAYDVKQAAKAVKSAGG